MRHLLMLILCCTYLSVSAQIYDDPLNEGEKYLNMTPNSPQATELVRYGSVPVNLANGQLSHQIPLYNIQTKDFSWPISLNYSYTGFKAEAKPSSAGLGWSLIAGGVVTREVRGLPDEWDHAEFLGYFTTEAQMAINDFQSDGYLNWFTSRNALEGRWDLEPDKYHVAAGNLNFSFKVKKNGNTYTPVIMSHDNYTVSFTFDEITVIDDKGVTYVFNQKEVHYPQDAPYTSADTPYSDNYTVSWFLSKIYLKDIPNPDVAHNTITFDYQMHNYRSRDFFSSGEHSTAEVSLNAETLQALYSIHEGFTRTDIQQPVLNRISFPNGTVHFQLNATDDFPRYKKMHVSPTYQTVDGSEAVLETAFLYYDLSYSGPRNLLEHITKNNEHFYTFDYYNKSKLISYAHTRDEIIKAQDHWGYYNGQLSNDYAIDIPGTIFTANKSPYFSFTVAGALKTITYPSKGRTEILYEPNTVKGDFSDPTTADNVLALKHKYRLQLGNRNEARPLREVSKSFTIDNYAFARIKLSEKTFASGDRVGISLRREGGDCTPGQFNDDVLCITPVNGDFEQQADAGREACNDQVPFICPYYNVNLQMDYGGDAGSPGPGGFQYYTNAKSTGGIVKIPPGTYSMKVKAEGTAEAFIEFSYIELPDEQDQNGNAYINVPIGGIRVSKTIDHDGGPNENLTPNVTVYDYNEADGLSTGHIFHKEYKSEIRPAVYYGTQHNTESASCFAVANYYVKTVSLHTMNPVNTNSGLPVFYPKVKTIKNPNRYISNQASLSCSELYAEKYHESPTNEDGSPIYKLLYSNNYVTSNYVSEPSHGYTILEYNAPFVFDNVNDYPFVPQGSEKTGNLLRRTRTFGLREFTETTYKASEAIQNYIQVNLTESEIEQIPLGLKIAEKVIVRGECEFVIPDAEIGLHYFQKPYRDYDVSFFPSNGINVTHSMEGLPLQTTTQSTVYNEHHYPSKTESTSSNGDLIETELYYAFDSPFGMNADLQSKNIIANPVASLKKRNTTVVGATKMSFSEFDGFPKLLSVAQAKGDIDNNGTVANDFVQQMHVVNYDFANNPIEVRQQNGTPVVYLWGYNYQHVIAKIENATYSQVQQLLLNYTPPSGQTGLDLGADVYAGLQQLTNAHITTITNYLRSQLSNAFVTSYTYKPLVGVASVTDPRNNAMYYTYDSQNRLEYILDEDQKVLEKNEYIIRQDD